MLEDRKMSSQLLQLAKKVIENYHYYFGVYSSMFLPLVSRELNRKAVHHFVLMNLATISAELTSPNTQLLQDISVSENLAHYFECLGFDEKANRGQALLWLRHASVAWLLPLLKLICYKNY